MPSATTRGRRRRLPVTPVLLIGLVLAGLGTLLSGLQARRHRRRIIERLRRATDEVVNAELIEPLRAETHGWVELARILERIA